MPIRMPVGASKPGTALRRVGEEKFRRPPTPAEMPGTALRELITPPIMGEEPPGSKKVFGVRPELTPGNIATRAMGGIVPPAAPPVSPAPVAGPAGFGGPPSAAPTAPPMGMGMGSVVEPAAPGPSLPSPAEAQAAIRGAIARPFRQFGQGPQAGPPGDVLGTMAPGPSNMFRQFLRPSQGMRGPPFMGGPTMRPRGARA